MTTRIGILGSMAAVLLLSGCAANRLYDWGNYDALLYKQYKDASQSVEARKQMEAHITLLETNKQKVPPGLYAEVGTFYLQANDSAKALAYYERERATWPESAPMMKAMIATLERRAAAKPPAAVARSGTPEPAAESTATGKQSQ